jgi:chemosensory pili system protein ChpC
MLAGHAAEEDTRNARVTVLKGLSGNAKIPFLAMLAQGFPRLTTITSELLITTGDNTEVGPGVHSEVLVRDDHAVIPDLGMIEQMIAQALTA